MDANNHKGLENRRLTVGVGFMQDEPDEKPRHRGA